MKVALQTIWLELSQEHVNKAVANFTKCYMAVATNGGHSEHLHSAITLCVSKSASSSHYQQTCCFQSHQETTGEYNAWHDEKWEGVVLVEIAYNFVIFRYI